MLKKIFIIFTALGFYLLTTGQVAAQAQINFYNLEEERIEAAAPGEEVLVSYEYHNGMDVFIPALHVTSLQPAAVSGCTHKGLRCLVLGLQPGTQATFRQKFVIPSDATPEQEFKFQFTGWANGKNFDRFNVESILDVQIPQAELEWIRPYAGYAVLTSGFGPRWGSFHNGSDYGLACGTPLLAVKDGTVIAASSAGVVLGNDSTIGTPASYVILDHGDGWQSYYWHLNQVDVQYGQQVSQGTVIGLSGNTGYVRGSDSSPLEYQGCHLHFELRYFGQPIDPETILP